MAKAASRPVAAKIADKTSLHQLGLDGLVKLVTAEAKENPSFQRQLDVALAKASGSAALIKLVDGWLGELEAERVVGYGRTDRFVGLLKRLYRAVFEELAALEPDPGLDAALRFAECRTITLKLMHEPASAKEIFNAAFDEIGSLAAKATAKSVAAHAMRLVDEFTTSRSSDESELIILLFASLAGDARDKVRAALRALKPFGSRDFSIDPLLHLQMVLADLAGDIDEWVAVAQKAYPRSLDPREAAKRYFKAGRFKDAWEWFQKPDPDIRMMEVGGRIAFSIGKRPERRRNFADESTTLLEIGILDGLSRKDEAKALLWDGFTSTLSETYLSLFMKRLGDFEEFDVLDKIKEIVTKHSNAEAAMRHYVVRANARAAADVVLKNHVAIGKTAELDERLTQAVTLLSDDFPLEASLLLRHVFTRAHSDSKLYAMAARALVALADLATRVTGWGDVPTHEAFQRRFDRAIAERVGLRKAIEAAQKRQAGKVARNANSR